MADSKISALPASTVPLAGTEVLPIVQSSTTRQVSVANLTAGRAISATQLTLSTGNLIVSASGKGVAGTTTNDNADAGVVGEIISSIVSVPTTGSTSGAYQTVTSISLTAGDWDVFGSIGLNGGATTTFTVFAGSISQTTTFLAPYTFSQQFSILQSTLTFVLSAVTPMQRISLASTTTVNLVGYVIFSGSTAGLGGTLIARRRR
jgi:hypothetical protein